MTAIVLVSELRLPPTLYRSGPLYAFACPICDGHGRVTRIVCESDCCVAACGHGFDMRITPTRAVAEFDLST